MYERYFILANIAELLFSLYTDLVIQIHIGSTLDFYNSLAVNL